MSDNSKMTKENTVKENKPNKRKYVPKKTPEEIEAGKRKRMLNLRKLDGDELPEGYNTKKIRFMRMILPKEKIDINDVDEMERRFYRYLELCEENDMKVGNMAAYCAMGLTKDQVFEFVNRSQNNPRRKEFLTWVQKVCSMYRENLMEDGKVNPVIGIFWQKNYDGMRDQQEVVVTPNNVLGEQRSADELRKKYLDVANSNNNLLEANVNPTYEKSLQLKTAELVDPN